MSICSRTATALPALTHYKASIDGNNIAMPSQADHEPNSATIPPLASALAYHHFFEKRLPINISASVFSSHLTQMIKYGPI